MDREFRNILLAPRKLKIVSSFYCDPSMTARPTAPEDMRRRKFHTHHDVREILLVLDGRGELAIGRNVCSGEAGTVFFIEPGMPHENGYLPDAPPGRHLWISIMPTFLSYSLITSTGRECRHVQKLRGYRHDDLHYMRDLLEAWERAEKSGGDPGDLAELRALVNLRAVQMPRICDSIREDDHIGTEQRNKFIITRAMDYIEEQCGRDCDIATLARISGCSRTHFMRLFSRHAGCPVLEFVNRQRIRRVNAMGPHVPLKLLAQELGFSSASAFIHWRRRNADAFDPKIRGSSDGAAG